MPAPVGFQGAGTSSPVLPQPQAGSCTFGEGTGGSPWRAAPLMEKERRILNFRDRRTHCFPRLVVRLGHRTPLSSHTVVTQDVPQGEGDLSWHRSLASVPLVGTLWGLIGKQTDKTRSSFSVFPLTLLLHLQVKL